MFKITILSVFILLFTSCSKSNSNGGPEGEGGRNPETPSTGRDEVNYPSDDFTVKAKSREEAISMLNQEDLGLINDWENRLVKSCSGGNIFDPNNENKDDENHLDLNRFIQLHGENLILEKNQHVIKWGYFNRMAGTINSFYRKSMSSNDSSYLLEAKLERNNGLCKLWVFNQPIYQWEVVGTMPVTAHSLLDQGKVKNSEHSGIPLTKLSQNQKTKIALSHEFGPLVLSAFKAGNQVTSILMDYLNLPKKTVEKIFPLINPDSEDAIIATVESPISSLYFSPRVPTLIGKDDDITKIFSLKKERGILHVYSRFNQVVKDQNDRYTVILNKNKKLNFKIGYGLIPRANKENYLYQLTSIDYLGQENLDKTSSPQCVRDFVSKNLELFGQSPLNYNHFNFFDIKRNCSPLSKDLTKDLRSQGVIYHVLPQIMAQVIPSKKAIYQGWDQAFIDEIMNLFEEKQELSEFFVKNSSWSIFESASRNLEKMNQALKLGTNLEDNMKNNLLKKGVSWALSNQEINQGEAEEMAKAFNQNLPHFEESINQVISSLDRDKNASREAIQFSLATTEDYKRTAVETLKLCQKYNDPTKWERTHYNKILQLEIPLQSMINLRNSLSLLDKNIHQYPHLNQKKEDIALIFIEGSAAGEITENNSTLILKGLNTLMRYKEFENYGENLIKRLKKSIADNMNDLEFINKTVSNEEYLNAVFEIKKISNNVKAYDWGDSFLRDLFKKRPTLDDIQKMQKVLHFFQDFLIQNPGTSSYDSFHESNEIVEKAIHQNWGAREFKIMERILPLGRHKMGCSHYQSTLGLIDCLSLKHFGTAKSEYFWPDYQDRYAKLAEEILHYLSLLTPPENFYVARRLVIKMVDSWEELVMKGCGQKEFEKRTGLLKEKVEKLKNLGVSDHMTKCKIENEMRELLKSCL